ncbi:hypothetical protein Pan241w_12220 [Gimesia alba]|uniref:Flp pilus assembly protein RcpC/CpaB domain-containing protein n=1 Tax=Gimesia alba TaxID=2527973 RepID=A0A517RBA5_9PLAN|nr:Flp pilus assembly protein CpaB [Gimesia alba]QDT41162.1 hypothetical protein Pan241w_12220 [Gimesia alba]
MKSLTPAKVSLLMFGVFGILIAAYIGKRLLAGKEEAPPVATRNIPMAISELEPGTLVTEEHLGLGPIAIKNLKPEMMTSNRVIVGRIVKERIPAATPISTGQLYPAGETPPIQVEPGMRAISVPLESSVDLVDGLIKPGEYVDVHMTPTGMNNDRRLNGGMTLTLFKGVRVIAINRSYTQNSSSRRGTNVTLELTPEQANIMILARDRGEITMSYTPEGKGNGGVAISNADKATLYEILGLKTPEKPKEEEPPKPFVVEGYYGSSRSVNQFDKNGVRIGDYNNFNRGGSRAFNSGGYLNPNWGRGGGYDSDSGSISAPVRPTPGAPGSAGPSAQRGPQSNPNVQSFPDRQQGPVASSYSQNRPAGR